MTLDMRDLNDAERVEVEQRVADSLRAQKEVEHHRLNDPNAWRYAWSYGPAWPQDMYRRIALEHIENKRKVHVALYGVAPNRRQKRANRSRK